MEGSAGGQAPEEREAPGQRPVELAQYTSFAFTAHLVDAAIDASIDTVGDALDKRLSSHCTSSPIEFV
ncbi:hypothetical protein ACWCQ1_50315 [Streptomyces sp. NPDC002144]